MLTRFHRVDSLNILLIAQFFAAVEMATVEVVHQNLPALVPAGENEEEEEEAWLKEIEDVAVHYVSLILGGDGQPMGGGKSPASFLSTVTPLSDGRPSNNASEIARKLKDIGDNLDARVKKEIVEATSALLTRRSVFQVGTDQFNRLCSGVLSNCSSVLHNGWQQVGAVYMTLGQLTRGAQPSAESAVVASRLSRFTSEYMAEVGLDTWLREHGGMRAILNEMAILASGEPVDILPPEQ